MAQETERKELTQKEWMNMEAKISAVKEIMGIMKNPYDLHNGEYAYWNSLDLNSIMQIAYKKGDKETFDLAFASFKRMSYLLKTEGVNTWSIFNKYDV